MAEISAALGKLLGGDKAQHDDAKREFLQFRKEALESMLQTASDNYKENARIAGVIEDKAQKAGAVAGIFLAAGLAFVKPGMNLMQVGGKFGFGLLSASILLLLLCISLCLGVMWARTGRSALLLSDVRRMVRDIFALSHNELTPEIREGLAMDQAALWTATLEEQARKNHQKAVLLRRAQATLVLAMFLVALFLFVMLLRAYKTPNALSI